MAGLGFYREYYTKNIRKFARYDFLSKHLDRKRFKVFKGVTCADCQRWERIPINYLSAREALALGIYLKTQFSNKEQSEKSLRYFEYAAFGDDSQNSDEIKYYGLMALGIFYFDEALKSPYKKQKKILKICDHYFQECESSQMQDELLALHQMIVEVAKDDKEAAVKFLVRASKVNSHPQVLFQVLSSIYLELGMEKVALFYSERSGQKEEAEFTNYRKSG